MEVDSASSIVVGVGAGATRAASAGAVAAVAALAADGAAHPCSSTRAETASSMHNARFTTGRIHMRSSAHASAVTSSAAAASSTVAASSATSAASSAAAATTRTRKRAYDIPLVDKFDASLAYTSCGGRGSDRSNTGAPSGAAARVDLLQDIVVPALRRALEPIFTQLSAFQLPDDGGAYNIFTAPKELCTHPVVDEQGVSKNCDIRTFRLAHALEVDRNICFVREVIQSAPGLSSQLSFIPAVEMKADTLLTWEEVAKDCRRWIELEPDDTTGMVGVAATSSSSSSSSSSAAALHITPRPSCFVLRDGDEGGADARRAFQAAMKRVELHQKQEQKAYQIQTTHGTAAEETVSLLSPLKRARKGEHTGYGTAASSGTDVASFSVFSKVISSLAIKYEAAIVPLLNPSKSDSLFVSHSSLLDAFPSLKAHARAIMKVCVQAAKNTQGFTPFEILFDDMVTQGYPSWPVSRLIPGFGTEGVMLYIKIGLCVTELHDELANSRALNYMTLNSRGIALWIGTNLHDLSVEFSKKEIRALMEETHVGALIGAFVQRGVKFTYRFQTPGMTVISPCGTGAMHFVVTVGSYVEQLSINMSTTADAIRAGREFWSRSPAINGNSFLATFTMFPALWLQKNGVQLGLAKDVQALDALCAYAYSLPTSVEWRHWGDGPDKGALFCDKCDEDHELIMSVRLGGLCIDCFLHMHPNAPATIDRRFK